MEFTLRLPEGFFGRMYTYGFYDRCFFRGNGGTTNVLRISGAHGYPECGTQRVSLKSLILIRIVDVVKVIFITVLVAVWRDNDKHCRGSIQ